MPIDNLLESLKPLKPVAILSAGLFLGYFTLCSDLPDAAAKTLIGIAAVVTAYGVKKTHDDLLVPIGIARLGH